MPILGSNSSGGSRPSAPVIGSATDGGTGTTASVAFTPSTYIGKGTITYTATSSPSGLTATGSSPITVTGLTTGTAYTFTVQGTTNYGVTSAVSSASNSVTPAIPTDFESIATATGNGTALTYTFSSIPSTYKSLQLRINALNGTRSVMSMRFNGDTSSNYAWHRLLGNGSAVAAAGSVSQTGIELGPTPGPYANYTTGLIVDIVDYASTTKNKTTRTFMGADTSTEVDAPIIRLYSGLWLSTSTVTSVTVYGLDNFSTGTTISLYGIKG